ncbi:hypothetical protein OS175_00210 [Marinicella sp. S1101]|uniref:hypothetical protein n=1 Tax=Marinicella marina TaxID=2996016 RepID=UPI002260DE9E|nr:hypothetical protein [Marinicella marina]MCX7552284.1 hypothetical protein [Marinicella marina]MDJ1139160.1 hypothetical protein [Marinicella marina]
MKNIIFICMGLILLTACGSEQAAVTEAQEVTELTTGNKFKDAAIKKVMVYNAGMNRDQAMCVVDELTADGVYGLGEINQLKLEPGQAQENSQKLYQAYTDAVASCQQ